MMFPPNLWVVESTSNCFWGPCKRYTHLPMEIWQIRCYLTPYCTYISLVWWAVLFAGGVTKFYKRTEQVRWLAWSFSQCGSPVVIYSRNLFCNSCQSLLSVISCTMSQNYVFMLPEWSEALLLGSQKTSLPDVWSLLTQKEENTYQIVFIICCYLLCNAISCLIFAGRTTCAHLQLWPVTWMMKPKRS